MPARAHPASRASVHACAVLLAGCASAQSLPPAPVPPGGGVLALPTRRAAALPGSAILPLIQNAAVADREAFVQAEIEAGNVPAFLRRLVRIDTSATLAGTPHTASFWVTPDYLGIGDDSDWFRMPLTPGTGQQLADALGCVLPTRHMVDLIWQQAPVKLAPTPFSPTQWNILSPQVFWLSHQAIEAQRQGFALGLLTAGIKKDVVASARIATSPGRVVIYGWHQLNGTPIQPLSAVHIAGYADYSHGIRLVERSMLVDGRATTVDAVLADPVLWPLLSDEGAFSSWRYPTTAVPPPFPLTDRFPKTGPELPWRAKFTSPKVVPFTPPSPGDDGWVLLVQDPAGGTETMRLGTIADADYTVAADLWCDYRPQLASNGFERIGVFARDQAGGAFDGTLSQQGACYALTWDSDTGRVQCLRVQNGAVTDLLPAPVTRPSTAWRRFEVTAIGSQLTFAVDGTVLLQVVDTTYPRGELGIGYHEFFATNALAQGTHADNFTARRSHDR